MHKTLQNLIPSLVFILALLLSSSTPFSYDRPPDNPRLLIPIKNFKTSKPKNQKSVSSILSTPNSPIARLLAVSANCKTGILPCETCYDNSENILDSKTVFDGSPLAATYQWNNIKFIDREGPFKVDSKDGKCRMVCAAGYRTAFGVVGNYDTQRCTQAYCKIFDYGLDECTSCWVEDDYKNS
jgi:hypothetical protein